MQCETATPPPLPTGPRRVHTRQQAAAIAQVPIGQIDAAIRRGELDVVRLGKHVRIPDPALCRFLGLVVA